MLEEMNNANTLSAWQGWSRQPVESVQGKLPSNRWHRNVPNCRPQGGNQGTPKGHWCSASGDGRGEAERGRVQPLGHMEQLHQIFSQTFLLGRLFPV